MISKKFSNFCGHLGIFLSNRYKKNAYIFGLWGLFVYPHGLNIQGELTFLARKDFRHIGLDFSTWVWRPSRIQRFKGGYANFDPNRFKGG